MASHSLKMQTVYRDPPGQEADHVVGERIVKLVRDALARNGGGAAAMCVRDERLDIVGLKQARELSMRAPDLLALLTQARLEHYSDPEAVAMIGRFNLRQGGPNRPGVPAALVFVEWSDCRWWLWRALIDPETGAIRTDTETVAAAVDGDTKPMRLGGWWSLARRRGLKAQFRLAEPEVVH